MGGRYFRSKWNGRQVNYQNLLRGAALGLEIYPGAAFSFLSGKLYKSYGYTTVT